MRMIRTIAALSAMALLNTPAFNYAEKHNDHTASTIAVPVLWKIPVDISSRDLLHGSGGLNDAPRAPFVFLKEDLDGTNPKFSVRDGNGIEWKVKLGVETRPEVAASRLLWAAGYFTAEYYFVPALRVEKMPVLKRGQNLLGPDGLFFGVRFKREPGCGKKVDIWDWRHNPFLGTREFNGLRVMMALINNWDLKNVNNAIIRCPDVPDAGEIYIISDLGASFGAGSWIRPLDHAKGNLAFYARSRFVRKIADNYVDLNIGTRPALVNAVNLPLYLQYLKMEWIGKRIPRSDARWIGELLSRLSPQQIRDALRGAGYAPHEVEGFSEILLSRIAELKNL
jgi:hypothetical protein